MEERLKEGTLDADGEDKSMAAAEVFGVKLPEYRRLDRLTKRKVLHDWQVNNERYLLKLMNCPHHCQIFKAQQRSYRHSISLFEFGTVYRHERPANSTAGFVSVA